MQSPRGMRVNKRKALQLPPPKQKRCMSFVPGTISSTPVSSDEIDGELSDVVSGKRLTASAGKVYFSDYSMHELPSEESCLDGSGDKSADHTSEIPVVVSTALVTRIEALETEAHSFHTKLSLKKPLYFRLENIAHSDYLVSFYTGFQSYELLLAFYEFLGPSVHILIYLGSKPNKSGKRRKMKLDPINQSLIP